MSNRVLAMAKPYSVEAVQATYVFTMETPSGQETVNPGDWVVCRDGIYSVYTDRKFQYDFEVVVDLNNSFNVEAQDQGAKDDVVGETDKHTIEPVTQTLKLVDTGGDGDIDSVESVENDVPEPSGS